MLRNVAGLSRAELETLMPGQPRFRAKQLFEASLQPLAAKLTNSGAISLHSPIMGMTSLPLSLREDLTSKMRVNWGEASIQQSKVDGTLKLLVKLPTESTKGLEHFVETVVIPSTVVNAPSLPATDADELETFGSPGTVCVSSQVGCSFACRFCRTGTQSMSHKLSAGEIVGQVLLAQAAVTHQQDTEAQLRRTDVDRSSSAVAAPSRVRSIVFMGQGEPLMNWPNVRDAIDILTDDKGLAFSPRRITVSTVGVAPRIPLVADSGARLALSLHSGLDETRTRIMPTNARFNVHDVQNACVEYLHRARSSRAETSDSASVQASHYHRHWSRISLEVTLLRGVNDSLTIDADSIARFAHGLGDGSSHVNLIPFNAWPGGKLQPSSKHRLLRFAERLRELGVPTTIRATRGRDVLAACGQLHSEQQRA